MHCFPVAQQAALQAYLAGNQFCLLSLSFVLFFLNEEHCVFKNITVYYLKQKNAIQLYNQLCSLLGFSIFPAQQQFLV